jgi:5-methylcytosine-specific restriction endonuclease McrA
MAWSLSKQGYNMSTFELNGKQYPWFTRMPMHLWRVMRQHVYKRDEGKCKYCGKPTELFECHIHHIFPLGEGGTNHPSNLKTVCSICHKIRHPHMRTARDKAREAVGERKES